MILRENREFKKRLKNFFAQANQRVEEFKRQLKSLKMRLNETEKRAVFAEQSVKSYLKELDMREGKKTFRSFFFTPPQLAAYLSG